MWSHDNWPVLNLQHLYCLNMADGVDSFFFKFSFKHAAVLHNFENWRVTCIGFTQRMMLLYSGDHIRLINAHSINSDGIFRSWLKSLLPHIMDRNVYDILTADVCLWCSIMMNGGRVNSSYMQEMGCWLFCIDPIWCMEYSQPTWACCEPTWWPQYILQFSVFLCVCFWLTVTTI